MDVRKEILELVDEDKDAYLMGVGVLPDGDKQIKISSFCLDRSFTRPEKSKGIGFKYNVLLLKKNELEILQAVIGDEASFLERLYKDHVYILMVKVFPEKEPNELTKETFRSFAKKMNIGDARIEEELKCVTW